MYSDIVDTIGFLGQYDSEVGDAMAKELARQKRNLELIASRKHRFPRSNGCYGQRSYQQVR